MNNFDKAPGIVKANPEKKISIDTIAKVLASLLAGGGAFTALEHHDGIAPNTYIEQVEKTNSNSTTIEPVVIGDEKISFNFDGKPKTLEDIYGSAQFEPENMKDWISLVYSEAGLSKKERASLILEVIESYRDTYTFGEKVSPAFSLAVELAKVRLGEAHLEEALTKVVDGSSEKMALQNQLSVIHDKISEIQEESATLLRGTSADINHDEVSPDTDSSIGRDISSENIDIIADGNDMIAIPKSSLDLQAELYTLLQKEYALMSATELDQELANLSQEVKSENLSREKLTEIGNKIQIIKEEFEFRKAG